MAKRGRSRPGCPNGIDRLRALARLEVGTLDKPAVLFLCVHNAGRSQMAAGWLRHLAGDAVDVFSGGSLELTPV